MRTYPEFPSTKSLCEKHNKYSATVLLAEAEEILQAELREAGKETEYEVKSHNDIFRLWSTDPSCKKPICTQALLPMVYYIRTSI